MKTRHTFRKQERLKSSKAVKQLFARGNTFLVHPFKVNWLSDPAPGLFPARVLVGVSRRNLRKAVQRNHMKRLVREAYRKHKYVLYEYLRERNLACDISLIYIGKGDLPYSLVEEKIIVVLERLITELDRH